MNFSTNFGRPRVFALLSLPSELIVQIAAEYLPPPSYLSLMRTNRFLNGVLRRAISNSVFNTRNSDYATRAIYFYAECSNAPILTRLYQKGIDNFFKKGELLTKAITHKSEEVSLRLLDAGASTEPQSERLHTVSLILAANKGYLRVLRRIAGAFTRPLDAQGTDSNAAISLAVRCGHTEIVRFLLSLNNLSFTHFPPQGDNFLHLAVRAKSLELVNLLLDDGRTNVNTLSYNFETALALATREGLTNIMQALLACPRVLVQVPGSIPPLHLAAGGAEMEPLEILLQDGRFNANLISNSWTPLMIAVLSGNEPAVSLLLIDPRMNAGATTQVGDTALHIAASKGYTNIVELILQYGGSNIDHNARTFRGKTPLYLAASKGHDNVVRALLTSQYSHVVVNPSISMHLNPLHKAATEGHTEIVKFLKSMGARCWKRRSQLQRSLQDCPH
ncbi:ankyrin repeat-containing domain protein [Tuber indicum]|nr:ankyrin repeat-containing domain protein [Tuber indicum]